MKSQCQRAVMHYGRNHDASFITATNQNKNIIDWTKILSASSLHRVPVSAINEVTNIDSIRTWALSEHVQTVLWKHIDPSIALSRRVRTVDIDIDATLFASQLLRQHNADDCMDPTNRLFWSVLLIPCYCLPKMDNYLHTSIDVVSK